MLECDCIYSSLLTIFMVMLVLSLWSSMDKGRLLWLSCVELDELNLLVVYICEIFVDGNIDESLFSSGFGMVLLLSVIWLSEGIGLSDACSSVSRKC